MTAKKPKLSAVGDPEATAPDVAADVPDPRFKDFGDALRASSLPPLYFDLCGKRFHCVPAMQSRKLMKFVKRAEGSEGASAGEVIHDFMDSCIVADDQDAWSALMDSDEFIIDVQLISDIVTWLITQYSSRPTQPPSA
jgi:hypothetical protein